LKDPFWQKCRQKFISCCTLQYRIFKRFNI